MIVNIIVNLMSSAVALYLGSKVLQEKLNYKSVCFFLYWIGLALYIGSMYFITASFIRIVCNFMVFIIVYYFYFHKSILKSSIASFVTLFILFVLESICGIILALVYMNQAINFSNFFLNIVVNCVINFLSIIIINNKRVKKFIESKLLTVSNSKKKSFMIILLFSILTLSILMYSIFFDLNKIFTLVLNIVIIFIYFYIIFNIFSEMSENERLQNEYETMLKSLKEYETMLDIQRVRNHENDNNLVSIRGMVKEQNKEAVEFINSLLKDKKNDDQYLILKTKDIPTGGLQGLIYQKLLLMKQKKIKYNIEVSKEIKKDLFKKGNADTIKNMCTITGVFLDNAIQAVEEYKEKLVGIYIYKEENELIITISNNYEGKLNISEFSRVGYTTKKEGHGYGLSLVKDIVEKSDNLKNIQKVNSNIITQILKIHI